MRDLFRKKSIPLILNDAEKGLHDDGHSISLKRTLTARDLTAFGIAAIVGAGIFSTIGDAAAKGGPAVSLLFVFTAVACAFSALCYAEFASMVPVSGSAYTYAYVAFGELIAWIIGWDLLLEYAIGNIVVAISWSDYFTGLANGLLSGIGLKIPDWMTMDYTTAYSGFNEVTKLLASGTSTLNEIPSTLLSAYNAWKFAPAIGSFRLIADIPALFIIIVITWLVYKGIKDSRNASNIMVLLKLIVIVMVIAVGFSYINPENWVPFAPHGLGGVMKGVSAVFFAYIGFDAISTTAEECKDPRRDLPRGIFYSLIICTVLYVLISLTLTGIVNYKELAVGDPLAFVFSHIGVTWMSWVVALSAIIAMAGVLLVFQMGQPRIWMSMSRDGLLPQVFSNIHPKYKTPSFSTIVTGFVVAIPTFFMNQAELVDLTSIGTLFAFVLVCGGVILMEKKKDVPERKFRVPYINSKFIVPALFVLTIFIVYYFYPEEWNNFFSFSANGEKSFAEKIPMLIFILLSVIITVLSFLRNLSLIPVLGLISCFYLMTELGHMNWLRFVIWLVIGLVIYFLYGYRKSKLKKELAAAGN